MNLCNIKIDGLPLIGKGFHSNVYLYNNKKNKNVLKITDFTSLKDSDKNLKMFIKECQLLFNNRKLIEKRITNGLAILLKIKKCDKFVVRTIMPYYNMSFFDWNSKYGDNINAWISFYFQLLYNLYVLNKIYNINHGDIHFHNIRFINDRSDGYTQYNVSNKSFYIKNMGFKLILIDFTKGFDNNNYYNDFDFFFSGRKTLYHKWDISEIIWKNYDLDEIESVMMQNNDSKIELLKLKNKIKNVKKLKTALSHKISESLKFYKLFDKKFDNINIIIVPPEVNKLFAYNFDEIHKLSAFKIINENNAFKKLTLKQNNVFNIWSI